MPTINAQARVVAGFAPVMTNADAAGDSYYNTGNERLLFRNSTGAPIVVTIDTPNPDNFGVTNNILDVTVNVPANSERYVAGPFRQDRHNDVNGKVQMTYSTNVGLSFAVLS
jgi:hypothetical protein